jgi:PKD repeat protein
MTVVFTVAGDTGVDSYYWQFGDGEESYEKTPSHIYRKYGKCSVILKTSDGGVVTTTRYANYITVHEGDLVTSQSNRCLRYAVKQDQGIGFYNMPVTNMPMPSVYHPGFLIKDNAGHLHFLVFDNVSGKLYDITTRKGPAASGLVHVWTGKDGTNLTRNVKFGEDTGSSESDFIKHTLSHLFIRPFDEDNRSATGFDAYGYPTGLLVDLKLYKDGAPSTPTTTIHSIPLDGDCKTDRKVEGHRLQLEVSTNRGSHLVINRQQIYIASSRAAAPDKRISTEHGYQAELADVLFWPWYRGDGTLVDRYSGSEPVITGITRVAGPEATGTQGMQFAGTLNFGSKTIAAATIMLWVKASTTKVYVGADEITLLTWSNGGRTTDWILKYAKNVTKTGALTVVAVTSDSCAHVRVVTGSVSDDAINYYGEDILDNSGKIVLPV